MERGSSILRGVGLFLLIWLTGALGWRLSFESLAWQDCLYKSLQLFGLNFDLPDAAGSVHPLLGVSRFMAPGIAALALVAALSSRFASNLRAVRNILRSNETAVIVGYGETGRAAARAVRKSRERIRIVAVDTVASDAAIAEAKGEGIELFTADALDARTTEAFPIRLSRADTIIVACGDDATSMAVAEELATRRHALGRKHGVVGGGIWMHVRSRRLLEQLREADFAGKAGEARLVHPFGMDEAVLQDLLLRHPPALRARQFGHTRVHVVIHGFDDFAWTAAEQILLNGQFPGPGYSTPLISVIVPDAAAAQAQWQARHGDLAQELDIDFHTRGGEDIGWIGNPEPLATIERGAPPSLHIFSLEDDRTCISAALALREAMERGLRFPSPIAVHARMRGSAAIAPEQETPVLQHKLHVIGDVDQAACFTVFGNRVLESFARAVHEDYLKLQPGAPFEELAETLQVSNRRAAYHFIHKLKLLGFEEAGPCDRALGIGSQGVAWLAGLSEPQKLHLSVLEHLRWRADRLLEGWRQGERDDERRLRDQLRLGWTHFDSLNQLDQRKDRSQLEAFHAINQGAAQLPMRASRIDDRGWEGPLPRWIAQGGELALRFDEQPDWRQCADGGVLRARILIPLEPELAASGFPDHNKLRAAVRAALKRFAAEQLALMPEASTIRFGRIASPGWDWLEPMERVDGVVLPPPVIGFAGHRDLGRLGDADALEDELLDHLKEILPPGGATLVTGAAAGADELMIRLWKRHDFGTVQAVFPFGNALAPRSGAEAEAAVAPDLLALIDQKLFPAPQLGENEHQAVARTILDRATMFVAVTDGRSGGGGGTEDMLANARERLMTVRAIRAPVAAFAERAVPRAATA